VTVAAALLVGLAVWWVVPAPAEPRLRDVLGRVEPPAQRDPHAMPRWSAAGAAVAIAMLWPTVPGVLLAVACAVLVPKLIGGLESRVDRRRREQLARQAPAVVDLLAATLASGAPMRAALSALSAAVDEPARGALRPVIDALDLGAHAALAWQPLIDDPVLAPVAKAVARSERTGAPLAALLTHLTADMRRERRAVVEVAARSAGVRAVLPLAACFLPAFLLLGVVPVIAALATELLAG
jgi:Flp pilus assembly protein TadB